MQRSQSTISIHNYKFYVSPTDLFTTMELKNSSHSITPEFKFYNCEKAGREELS